MRAVPLILLGFLLTDLSGEAFSYAFTARVTEIRQNQANYLGGIEAGTILEGSFGITDEPLLGEGRYRSVFLELKTPEIDIRVDFPPLLYLWWRDGHFELGWDNDGSIQLPWTLSAFAIDLEGHTGGAYPDYLPRIDLRDFTAKTLTLSGEHVASSSDFDLSLELETLHLSDGAETQGKRFYLDSSIRFFNNDLIRDLAFDDECLWLGGSGFYRPNGRQPLERLFLNGEADESFNMVGGFRNADGSAPVIHRIERMSDGDLFVVGWFSHYMDIAVGHYARLNPDGSLDPDFLRNRRSRGEAAGADGLIRAIQHLPEGNYLLGGDFSIIDGFFAIFSGSNLKKSG